MGEAKREGEKSDRQAEAVAFLADRANHEGAIAGVERFDTHGARIFVAGERAYKIKRAVRYPYLDFSTLARRRAALEHELELNRRTTPELYIEVRPLLRAGQGGLAWGESASPEDAGRAVEWVLVMRAFDQEDLLDRVAARGELTEAIVLDLAEAVIAQHRAAPVVRPPSPNRGGAAGIAETVAENREDFEKRPELFPPEALAALERGTAAAIEANRALLDRRLQDGLVRLCHGDLHLRNICLIEGRPRLFDALEFDDAIASNDRLYDLAFLLMDLEQRGLHGHANLLFNRYVLELEEAAALAALPLFLSVRAAIRAKVAATVESSRDDDAESERRKARDREEARDYFAAARAYLAPAESCLVAVGGLSGSGKSSLARRLAPLLGPAPGALLLRSDVLRKRLFGLAEIEPLPEAAYGRDVTRRVYETMQERARIALAAGQAVVLDAVHARPGERDAVAALARAAGRPLAGLWLDAEPEVLLARVAARRAESRAGGDASDADAGVVRQQLDYDLGAMDWRRIAADGPPETVLAEAREAVAGLCPGALRPGL